MPPVLDPEPMLPVLEPVDPPLVEPLPSEPGVPVVLPEVAPAPVALEPSSFRHWSFCSPVSESQRDAPVLAPVEAEPLTSVDEESLVDGEPMLLPLELVEGELVDGEGEVLLLEPAAGELVLLLPMPLAPVLPLAPPELWANAPDMAKSAAAVAETTSFRFICAPSRWLERDGTAAAGHARPVPPALRQLARSAAADRSGAGRFGAGSGPGARSHADGARAARLRRGSRGVSCIAEAAVALLAAQRRAGLRRRRRHRLGRERDLWRRPDAAARALRQRNLSGGRNSGN
jgi:hypothetical protein